MSNLIRGEFYKLRKSKYFIVTIIISIAISFPFIEIWSKDVQRSRMLHHGIYSIEYAFMFISFSCFLFALLAEDFIAKDFKNKNISKSFIYGYSRREVILSKLAVFIMFSLFLELIYTVILVTYASMTYGFCDTLDTNDIIYLFRMVSIGVIYNVATMSLIGTVAVIIKSSFFTFISPFILFLGYYLFLETPLGSKKLFLVISYIHPYLRGMWAMGRFTPIQNIITGATSSILIFTITIAGSLLYVKYEDIK
ncbi:ABC transporter permease [Clostridium scatologenes]|uniref:Putative transmembrane protein n=1 Tax=Clostridium scatologenes TaxID=1548 RepID=A0A0E3M7W1_CLOSL|nr:ABC transporter permease [Clostridium scatologenes]AKA68147.1 putative transmembrane protein [Clostridium scatologenes]